MQFGGISLFKNMLGFNNRRIQVLGTFLFVGSHLTFLIQLSSYGLSFFILYLMHLIHTL